MSEKIIKISDATFDSSVVIPKKPAPRGNSFVATNVRLKQLFDKIYQEEF